MEIGGVVDEDGGVAPLEMTKVSVAVRVRPLIDRECKAEAQLYWQIGAKELRPYDPEAKRVVPNTQTYIYDHVFDHSTQTQQVYEKVVSPIVMKAFKGFNGTILCYGQTSSGKTHTLYGSNEDKGIILLFADHLFQHIKSDESLRQYIIKVGLIEIYNEKVTDLLNSYNPIELQERDGSIVPYGLEELTVFDIDDWKKVTERVQRERKIGETRMNKESSRSHTILRVTIESFDLASNPNPTFNEQDPDNENDNSEQSPPLTTAVLHFVDLAGSEKQSQTGAEGERFREQVNINMSLSVLSRVIQQLSEQTVSSSYECFQGKVGASGTNTTEPLLLKAMCNSLVRNPPKSRFINFRDSKLTRLLKSSLNGDAFVSMICNVTIASFEETKSTLLFAKQAKKIQIRPKQNLCSTKSEYEKKLLELQDLLTSKDKEVIVLRRQCENLKRAFEFRGEQNTQRSLSIDRRLSLCPTLFRPASTRARHSTPEPTMSAFSYYKNKYSLSSSSSSVRKEGDEFFSAEDFMRSLRSPLKSIRESLDSGPIRFDKEVQTDDADFEQSSKRHEEIQHEIQAENDQTTHAKSALVLSGTPASTLRLNNVLLRTAREEDEEEWKEQKAFLELENQTLKEELDGLLPKLKEEVETLRFQNTELELDAIQALLTKDEKIKSLTLELESVKAKQEEKNLELESVKAKQEKKNLELEPKLKELQISVETLISKNEGLQEELRSQIEIVEERTNENQKQQAEIESMKMETEKRRRQDEDELLNADQKMKKQVEEMECQLNEKEKQIGELSTVIQEREKSYSDKLETFNKSSLERYTKILTDKSKVESELNKAKTEIDVQHSENLKLMAIVKEHESCKNLDAVLEQVKVLETAQERAELTITKLREELAFVSEKKELERANMSEQIETLRAVVKEHESLCGNRDAELNLVQDEFQQLLEELMASKLKKEDVENELRAAEEQNQKLRMIVHQHENCVDLVTQLNTARNHVDTLKASRSTLTQELKAQKVEYEELKTELERIKIDIINQNQGGSSSSPNPPCVVTRATQYNDLDEHQYREASIHYRKRAHNSEFELQQVRKDLDAMKQDYNILLASKGMNVVAPQRMERPKGLRLRLLDNETQCDLLNELLGQTKREDGGGEALLESIPEVAKLISDLKAVMTERDNLKLDLKQCTCHRHPKPLFGGTAAEKSTESTKYNRPSGMFQQKIAFFQAISSPPLLSKKEGIVQPARSRPKSIENAPQDLPCATSQLVPQTEEKNDEEEEYDPNWLMKLVQKLK